MGIVTIHVNSDELHKLDKYHIVDSRTALRSFVTGSSNICELSDYEIDKILDHCEKAIKLMTLGVRVDIELGRSPQNDLRTYTLMDVCLSDEDDEDCDLKVSDMIVYMNEYLK